MIKTGQSLLDFITSFPFESMDYKRINDKEAEILVKIWKQGQVNDNKFSIPQGVSEQSIVNLITKGAIKSINNSNVNSYNRQFVEITKTGQEAIRDFVLQNETSDFKK